MVDQAHALIPEARVGFVGVARDEETHQPTPYLESLPDDLSTTPVFVLDPMLATGGSMAHTIGLLQARNAVDITAICVVVAPEGIAALEKVAPDIRLFTATIDDRLNDIAYIVPGPRRRGRPAVRAALELACEFDQLLGSRRASARAGVEVPVRRMSAELRCRT